MNKPTAIEPEETTPEQAGIRKTPDFRESWPGRAFGYFAGTQAGRYYAAFASLVLVALVLRLWELGGRTMHYDEAIHLYYSWRLSNFEGFVHSPWMHGPFQIELVALFLRLLGDTDFTARLAYVLFGALLVFLPYFLREHLGRAGALLTGLLLAVSPSLLYFSRFGRNDIIMAALAVALFALLWHYTQRPRNRYLYLAAALLAVAFASKETAYIITLIFGALAFLLAIPYSRIRLPFRPRREGVDLTVSESTSAEKVGAQTEGELAAAGSGRGWFTRLKGWLDLNRLNPAAGFLVLLATLTLPQWSAGVELARDIAASLAGRLFGAEAAAGLEAGFGLTLAGREGIGQGIVGAPVWDAPFVQLPLDDFPLWLPGIFVFLIIALCIFAGWKLSQTWRQSAAAVCLPVVIAYAAALALLSPIGAGVDIILGVLLAGLCVVAFPYLQLPWRHSLFLLFLPALATMAYCLLFLPVLQVDALLVNILPEGIQVASDGNAVPLNFLVAGGILLTTGTVSLALGLWWRGGTWLICAAIFYGIWIALFTTFFTNPAGLFSGVWQGMGYWIAQQDVARGNQPWYYYLVGLSVYEFLPVIFGVIGAIVFVRRRDRFGMALAFWAGVNFLAYTIASEKMPWLLVNITLPFIFLAGKLLGELTERIDWRTTFNRENLHSPIILLAMPAIVLTGLAYGVIKVTNDSPELPLVGIGVLLGSAALALAGAWLVRRVGPLKGPAVAALGIAAALFGFTVWTALQAAYTYDDSRREILVYAQGGADLRDTFQELEQAVFERGDSTLLSAPVQVDYDVWYPFQWYVRHHLEEGTLRFSCFRDEGGAGGCAAIEQPPEAAAVLVAAHHRPAKSGALTGFSQAGPRRNLLWFPETYRRPGEDRQSEVLLEEVKEDLLFFRKAAADREKWNQALNYLLKREMEADWFNSEYYTYRRGQPADSGPAR